MRKFLGTMLTVLAALVQLTPAASAANGNAHFIGNHTSGAVSGHDLVLSFKEAGLAAGSVETITATATVTSNWFCVNRGSSNPQASNKRTSSSTVSVSGTFTADQHGNIIGQLTIPGPTTAPSDFSCPSGQSLELGSITFSNVSLVDNTSGARFNFNGTSAPDAYCPVSSSTRSPAPEPSTLANDEQGGPAGPTLSWSPLLSRGTAN